MNQAYIKERVQHWIKAQHGTAGWEIKLENLVADMVLEVEEQKNQAYDERNRVVAALSKCFPSYLARHDEDDANWEDDWRWIVFIELPNGQASWHIHDGDLPLFRHLSSAVNCWDGHTTSEKYERLDELAPQVEAKGGLWSFIKNIMK